MKERNTVYSVNLISKYRSMLMGCAIIGVILCHLNSNLSKHGLPPSGLSKVLTFGSVGVDIFLFLSGFGLYYSCTRHRTSYSEYMKKRVLRILPDYLIVGGTTWVITDLLINKVGIIRFLENITFISMFTRGTLRYWYIFAILVFYALFPFIFTYIENHKHPGKAFFLFFIIFWVFTAYLEKIMPNYSDVNLFIERFPIFVFGAICGKWGIEGKTITALQLSKACLIGVIIVCVYLAVPQIKSALMRLHYAYYIRRGIFGIALIIGIILVMEYIEKHMMGIFRVILKVFCCLGGVTLEIYLFHQSYRALFGQPYTFLGYFGGVVVLPVISAFVYKWIKNNIKRKEKICENI